MSAIYTNGLPFQDRPEGGAYTHDRTTSLIISNLSKYDRQPHVRLFPVFDTQAKADETAEIVLNAWPEKSDRVLPIDLRVLCNHRYFIPGFAEAVDAGLAQGGFRSRRNLLREADANAQEILLEAIDILTTDPTQQNFIVFYGFNPEHFGAREKSCREVEMVLLRENPVVTPMHCELEQVLGSLGAFCDRSIKPQHKPSVVLFTGQHPLDYGTEKQNVLNLFLSGGIMQC